MCVCVCVCVCSVRVRLRVCACVYARVCVRDVFTIYDNNISPRLMMIIIKIISLFHTNQTH